MNRKKILKYIKETVRKVSPEATIILYGSEARGDSKPDSDVDILILVNKEILSYKDVASITDPIYDIELKTGVLISPLVYTQKQWENRPIKTPFYINVMNEGIRLGNKNWIKKEAMIEEIYPQAKDFINQISQLINAKE